MDNHEEKDETKKILHWNVREKNIDDRVPDGEDEPPDPDANGDEDDPSINNTSTDNS